MDTGTISKRVIVAHDPSRHPGDGTGGVPARKTRAAVLLAPVLSVMAHPDLHLFDIGYKVALKDDMAGVCQYDEGSSIPAETRERLTLARNIIRERMTPVNLLTVPDTLILYGNTAVTLLGDPPVTGTTSSAAPGWHFL